MGLNQDPAPADVVRSQYLASAAGDLEALRATLAPDVEWTEMSGFPLAGTYRTPDGVTTNVMERLAAEWEGWVAHDDTNEGGSAERARESDSGAQSIRAGGRQAPRSHRRNAWRSTSMPPGSFFHVFRYSSASSVRRNVRRKSSASCSDTRAPRRVKLPRAGIFSR